MNPARGPVTKRAAHLAAQAAEAAARAPSVVTDASGVRIRSVGVHLTPFWPGLSTAPVGHPSRWKRFWGVTPAQVLRATLRRLQLSPRAAGVAVETPGDVSLLGPVPPALLGLISDADREAVPFAVFFDGVTEAEIREALAGLAAAGWQPEPRWESAP